MSKYVRTKNKIYELYDKYLNGNYVVWAFDYGKDGNFFKKYLLLEECEIVKEADTIEELCDCYVSFLNNGTPEEYRISPLKIFKHHSKDWEHEKMFQKTNRFIVYGAIWTNKGLIYVAKMNTDGKLVLM